MDVGTEEGPIMEPDSATVEKQMVAEGYQDGSNLKTYVDQGAFHSENYWGGRFYMPMTFLYGP
jgi:hypothetical protein